MNKDVIYRDRYTHAHIYIMEYYSAMKRMKSCHLQQHRQIGGYYAQQNKLERQIPYNFTVYVKQINRAKQKQNCRHREQTGGGQSRGEETGERQERGIKRYKLPAAK